MRDGGDLRAFNPAEHAIRHLFRRPDPLLSGDRATRIQLSPRSTNDRDGRMLSRRVELHRRVQLHYVPTVVQRRRRHLLRRGQGPTPERPMRNPALRRHPDPMPVGPETSIRLLLSERHDRRRQWRMPGSRRENRAEMRTGFDAAWGVPRRHAVRADPRADPRHDAELPARTMAHVERRVLRSRSIDLDWTLLSERRESAWPRLRGAHPRTSPRPDQDIRRSSGASEGVRSASRRTWRRRFPPVAAARFAPAANVRTRAA